MENNQNDEKNKIEREIETEKKEITETVKDIHEKEREIQKDKEKIKEETEEIKRLEKELLEKEFKILVNSREKNWNKTEISYSEVVILAYGSYSTDPNVIYSITYSRGNALNHRGTLVLGDTVKVKNGMVFDVTFTNKS
jgi:predicted RNase H-like nuclease (RuvC/YqgF family)